MDHTRLLNRVVELSMRDLDVSDIQLVLGHFGTENDKPPMTIRWHVTTLIPFGEESVFTVLDVVAKSSFDRSDEGKTVFF